MISNSESRGYLMGGIIKQYTIVKPCATLFITTFDSQNQGSGAPRNRLRIASHYLCSPDSKGTKNQEILSTEIWLCFSILSNQRCPYLKLRVNYTVVYLILTFRGASNYGMLRPRLVRSPHQQNLRAWLKNHLRK